jgi:hypothetical protein
METKSKPRGNPAWAAKTKAANTDTREKIGIFRPWETDPTKEYEFELVNTVEQGQPVDRDNDKPIGEPYPRIFTRPNEGLAYDEVEGKARAWRYILGQPSIWVDEQVSLANAEPKEVNQYLSREENQIEFVKGKCIVKGVDTLKFHALVVHDAFEGKTRQLRSIPRVYRLVNHDAAAQKLIDVGDLEYQAKKLAYECDDDEMLQSAFTLGIDVNDLSKSGINKIKLQFRNKAVYDPANPKSKEALQLFISVMENPLTKVKYIFAQGFKQGIISADQLPGKITWAMDASPIMDLMPNNKPIDQLCGLVFDSNELAMTVFETIEAQLNQITE